MLAFGTWTRSCVVADQGDRIGLYEKYCTLRSAWHFQLNIFHRQIIIKHLYSMGNSKITKRVQKTKPHPIPQHQIHSPKSMPPLSPCPQVPKSTKTASTTGFMNTKNNCPRKISTCSCEMLLLPWGISHDSACCSGATTKSGNDSRTSKLMVIVLTPAIQASVPETIWEMTHRCWYNFGL